MARLTQQQCIELIKKPKNSTYINEARLEEQRLMLHCEPTLHANKLSSSPAYAGFIQWVKSFLPVDKHARFEQMITMPIDTVESTKTIFDELSKFMGANDRFVKFYFNSENIAKDQSKYWETLKDSDFWTTTAFDELKTGINSYIVIDMAAKQVSMRPEPYYYFVSIHQVHDVDINEHKKNVEYFIYNQPGEKKIVLDDEFYRVFSKANGGDWAIEVENRHSTFDASGQRTEGLGYAPVVDFYSISAKNTGGIVKRGPITDSLGKLDWLLYFRTSKKHLDLYSAWPIIVAYMQRCHYKDEKGNECLEGFINTTKWNGAEDIETQIKCPACSKRNMIGAGTYLEVMPPVDKDGFDMMANPLKIIEAPEKTLAWVVTEIERLEDEIYLSSVGYDGDAMNNKAVNENQVAANFESKESILNTIKKQWERAMKFVGETVCRLRYGNMFLNSTVDLGNDFFLLTADQLTAEIKLAKDAGMPAGYISALRAQIVNTKFKNNPEQLTRQQILADLEPYPDMPIAQVLTAGVKDIDPEGYVIKLNFTTFIREFERENTDIVIFGSLSNYNEKISTISKTLKEYANRTIKKSAPSAWPDPAGNEGPAGKTTTG